METSGTNYKPKSNNKKNNSYLPERKNSANQLTLETNLYEQKNISFCDFVITNLGYQKFQY